MKLKSIAIRQHFAHHAKNAGYKRILDFTQPCLTLGIDERLPANSQRLLKRYEWLTEFQAAWFRLRSSVDIVHVLYAESYYRFSPWILLGCPVVATFHQPPERLNSQLLIGGGKGRASAWVHQLTSARFQYLDAAIIISENQREVLQQFIPADRIHHIPLGLDVSALRASEEQFRAERQQNLVLTVGNWLRDWDYYFGFIEYCLSEHPNYRFRLINRRLPGQYLARCKELPNLEYLADVDDDDLASNYAHCAALFLPLVEATENNTVNEAKAFGCPLVSNVSLSETAGMFLYDGGYAECLLALEHSLDLDESAMSSIKEAYDFEIKLLDWAEVGRRTMSLYVELVNKNKES